MAIKDFNDDRTALEITSSSGFTVIFLIISKFLSFLLLAVAFIVVARILGPSNYGIYTLVIVVTGVFDLIGNFGISTTLNRFISEYHFKHKKKSVELLISNSFLILLIVGIILTGLMFSLSSIIAHYVFHNSDVINIIKIASFIILITLLYSSSLSALIGFNNRYGIIIAMFIEAVIQSIISIILVVFNYGALGPILGIIFGQLVGFLIAYYFIFIKMKIKIRISIKQIKKIILFSLPITISNVIGSLVPQLAPIILAGILIYFSSFSLISSANITSNIIMGNFGIASKVGYFVDVVLGSITLSLLSIFSKLFSNNKFNNQMSKYYNYSLYLAFIFVSPLLLFIAVLSKQFSYTIFSGYYTLAPTYLIIVSIGILVSIFSIYANALLISKNKVKEMLKINIKITVVQLILMPFLLFLFHGIGLVILLFLSSPILSNIFLLNKINKLFKVKIEIKKIVRVLLANIFTIMLMIPFILLEPNYFVFLLIIGILLVLLIYPILLAKTKAVKDTDLNTIKEITKKIPLVNIILNFYIKFVKIFLG